ncbi:DUF3857 domain-containing transglutaminase family protein [Mucilaginibacter sp. PAMB04168]|uniref:DUF3857 domain-containing transglutaminase family protein n=1 Tax=Mucilaginibacter sp. PAMB04168 TaxID=3138567 RepID=UPI0031F6104D
MKRLKLTLVLGIIACQSYAQARYEVAAIAKDLLPYASAVVRNMEVTTEVKDLTNTTYHYKTAVTVLNKNGDSDASIRIWYDKSRRIKYLKGTLYNELGMPVNKFSDKNFTDQSAADGFSMFTDTRFKYYQPAVTDYPYTVEYEYEVNAKQSLNLSEWQPNAGTGTAVEHSSFQLVCKPDFPIRYKEINYQGKAKTATNAAGLNTYSWEVSNLKALRNEPYSPDPERYQTMVKIAPDHFTYEGFEGSFSDWKGLGGWVYSKLLVGRTVLQPATVAFIRGLTDTITSQKLKAKAIYEYMQRKSRYVSIQVGIGGLRPFTASEVDQLSYGDCKGLVNYTQALLKAVNIESYYCIVQAGSMKKSLMPDFASIEQGNHIILCLPFKNDTTWLECTSKHMPFGFLGDFTDDRWVLACTPDGGKLMHTPVYTSADSRQSRKAMLTLKEDGELAGNMVTTFEGTQYDNITLTPGEISDEIKDAVKRYSIENLEIEDLKLSPLKTLHPVNNEEMKFKARDYASVSRGKLFFMANLANRRTSVPREVRNRTTEVYINRGYTDVDEITYQIPAGYKLDNNPLLVTINKPFGRYTASAFLNKDNQVVYKRTLEIIDGTYPKEKYEELVDFYQHVADADNHKIALVKAN